MSDKNILAIGSELKEKIEKKSNINRKRKRSKSFNKNSDLNYTQNTIDKDKKSDGEILENKNSQILQISPLDLEHKDTKSVINFSYLIQFSFSL